MGILEWMGKVKVSDGEGGGVVGTGCGGGRGDGVVVYARYRKG